MKVLMIRHGEILSNVNRIYAGRSNERLTARGMMQADQVADKLSRHKIDALYASPIQRAMQTAEIIAQKNGIALQINDAFRELEMGPWEGMSEDDVARDYPDEWRIWNTRPADLSLPGRETLEELLVRILNGIRGIYVKSNERTVAIVTHVAVIRILLLWHAKKSLNLYKSVHIPNAKIFRLSIDTCPAV